MTIDTNELRRLAQKATHPATKGCWMRLFGERTVYDRMEDGCRGIPIVATDNLPAKQESAYLDFIAAANPAAISELLDRLEAAEKERDAAELMSLAMRAKIAEMEKQEPFGWLFDGDFYEVRQMSLYKDNEPLQGQTALYALPGAQTQPAPSVPEGWKLVPIEPTPSMAASIELSTANSVSEIYCAMIAAAPEAKP